jgi:uncharacterized protein
MNTIAIDEAALDRIEELLYEYPEAMRLDELQGFLCAVVTTPQPLPPAEWLPHVLGDPVEDAPVEADPELDQLLIALHDAIAADFAAGRAVLPIVYGVNDSEESPLDYAAWTNAYLYGTEIGEQTWPELAGEYADDLDEIMEPFFFLNGTLGEEARKGGRVWLSQEDEDAMMTRLEDTLPGLLAVVYRFWEFRRAPVQPRQSSKVGRNDPCPCGSGKKYKQCCGAAPILH